MQLVLLCGGKGTRLRPFHQGPKSLVRLGNATLLARLIDTFLPHHRSSQPPIAIVDHNDALTPDAVGMKLRDARIVRQPRPDGVANALLLAEPILDDVILAVLGDLVVEGRFSDLPASPAVLVWKEAAAGDTRNNFGVAINNGTVRRVVEKPYDVAGLQCGIGAYVLDRKAVASLRNAAVDTATGERGITAGIQAAIDAGVRFTPIEFSGYYNNVNAPADVEHVERFLAASASS